ncbi:hypothetical protein ACFLRI_01500 [Bacteroidota bacterium]
MKTILFITLLSLGAIIHCFSQTREFDKIYRRDGREFEVILVEVGIEEVKYRKSTNPDGPLFILLKAEILFIEYRNGETESFNNPGRKHKRWDDLKFGDNIIGINLFGSYSNDLMFNYERISQRGWFGTKVSFYMISQSMGSGLLLDEKYYLNGQKVISPFLGCGFEYASIREDNKLFDSYGISLFAGASFHPFDYFNCSFEVGPAIGFIQNNSELLNLRIGADIGIRF